MIDKTLIQMALVEDLQGGQDLTSVATIPENSISTADFVTRKDGVLAGIEMVAATLATVGLREISIIRNDDNFCTKTPREVPAGNLKSKVRFTKRALNTVF